MDFTPRRSRAHSLVEEEQVVVVMAVMAWVGSRRWIGADFYIKLHLVKVISLLRIHFNFSRSQEVPSSFCATARSIIYSKEIKGER